MKIETEKVAVIYQLNTWSQLAKIVFFREKIKVNIVELLKCVV
jgi:hypothetical protein